MKALVFHEPHRIAVEDVPDVTPGPGELVVDVAAAAICHSDIRVYLGQKHAKPGVVPGHELAGFVSAVGAGVDDFSPGDRVVICPIVACGTCVFCVSGRQHRCVARRTLGYDENGGLAERVLIPAQLRAVGHVLRPPARLSLQRACFTEPLACVLNSLETCEVRTGSSVVVIGAGPMGLYHVLLARKLGAGSIIVSELDPARTDWAKRLGATAVIDPRSDDLAATVNEHTAGLGAEAVVITAGLADVLEQALAIARPQGVVSLFAGFPPGTRATFDVNVVHYKEIRLTGSQNASPTQYRRTMELLPYLPEVDELATHRFALADAAQAYEVRLKNEGLKSMVLVDERAG
jgi:2-desacetyl-2-hydroxyethyl bacteriochlorophyllide A dehydrogenase